MLQFQRVRTEEDIFLLLPYLKDNPIGFCDYSAAVRYMWRDSYCAEYAFANDTLILKEVSPDGQETFYFPLGKDPFGALFLIEQYAQARSIPLRYGYLDGKTAELFAERYPFSCRSYDRDWCDYFYRAEDMQYFRGKKLAGQRNHLNKFERLYPDCRFSVATPADTPKLKALLAEYVAENPHEDWLAREENRRAAEFLDVYDRFGMFAAYLSLGDRVIAFSVGEKAGDVLIVHLEKALKRYEGVYQKMVSSFARQFATEEIRFINREEDCGNLGLRTSKTQYHPIRIAEKYILSVGTAFDALRPCTLHTARLTLSPIGEADGARYRALATNDALNRLWGYDYREDIPAAEATEARFLAQLDALVQKREEYSFAIRLHGLLIGEVVLHGFDRYGGVEIGFRLYPSMQKQGYATEAVSAVKQYIKETLCARYVKAKCKKENAESFSLLRRCGLYLAGEDETYYYFREVFR